MEAAMEPTTLTSNDPRPMTFAELKALLPPGPGESPHVIVIPDGEVIRAATTPNETADKRTRRLRRLLWLAELLGLRLTTADQLAPAVTAEGVGGRRNG
jgi:hypothetical protein